MDLDNISLMKMLQTKMKYQSARQDAISQNIANADTPDYKRRDIEKPNFGGMLKASMVKLETTNPKHISGINSSSSGFTTFSTDDTVEVDMEAIELMKNNSEFAKASTTYKKILSLMKEAVGNK